MKGKKFIQLKAAFLLIVFFMNTVVGFACAIKCSMGDAENKAVTLVESTHHHNGCAGCAGEKTEHQQKENKDNCCHDKVTNIAQADKALPQTSTLLHPLFLTAFASSFYNINILFTSQKQQDNKYLVRSHHPPISDIRIAVQSFQI